MNERMNNQIQWVLLKLLFPRFHDYVPEFRVIASLHTVLISSAL